MTDPLLDRLRTTAHTTAPEPGDALDTVLVMTRGRRLRRRRHVFAAVGGAAALATVAAIGAPVLTHRAATVQGPAAAPSASAPATPTTPAPSKATKATGKPPAAVDLGHGHIAATGVAGDRLSPLDGLDITFTPGGDDFHVVWKFPTGRVFGAGDDGIGTYEPRSREIYHWGYSMDEMNRNRDDATGKPIPEYPVATLGILGAGTKAPRAALLTTQDSAVELPVFQVEGSDRWLYAYVQTGPEATWEDQGGRQRVVIRDGDGTYQIGDCMRATTDGGTCGVEPADEWMVDIARKVLG